VEGAYPILYFDFPKWHTQEGTGVLYFISEFEVIQSNVEARPPGTRISFSRKMSNRAAPGDVKALVAALVGCDHT
ncbi:MAG: hypothetical protein GTN78_03145, partial [Gemmatimonadales bacterium]|nr:hypothetical protein [Gemmatimonadales bacterium]